MVMTMPEVNKPLLRECMEVIRQQHARQASTGQKRWYQASWRRIINKQELEKAPERCDTAMCLAGWAVELDPRTNWLWTAPKIKELLDRPGITLRSEDFTNRGYGQVQTPNGMLRDINLEHAVYVGMPGEGPAAVSGYNSTTAWDGDATVRAYSARSAGQALLGLTTLEADALFAAGNSYEELCDYAQWLLDDKRDKVTDYYYAKNGDESDEDDD